MSQACLLVTVVELDEDRKLGDIMIVQLIN